MIRPARMIKETRVKKTNRMHKKGACEALVNVINILYHIVMYYLMLFTKFVGYYGCDENDREKKRVRSCWKAARI